MNNDSTGQEVDRTTLDAVVIRFCGDSGDGMQLAGGRFTDASAIFGNDFATFPDYPAEIRAPRGTTFGVSGFQVQLSSRDIHTPGEVPDALVAMNPAGFKVNIDDVKPGGIVIVNEDEFTPSNFAKCNYPEGYNPLEDEGLLEQYTIIRVPMNRMTREAGEDSGLGAKIVDRSRNMFALGLVYWLFDRQLDSTIAFLEETFAKKKGMPEVAAVNIAALQAGYYFGETAEFPAQFRVPPAQHEPGTYRRIDGNEATVLGLVTAARKAHKNITYASYPITPASNVLHGLSRQKNFGIKTFQAEDEIAAVCAAIGASYAGDIGVTGTSGPGLALKGEAIGLAVMLELPLVVVDVQRAGPATGMPTKTEQADLFQAMFGRSGESPCIIIAASTPSDCFTMAYEAVRLAVAHMSPVIFLSDAYLGNGAEPWRIPEVESIPDIVIKHPTRTELGLHEGEAFMPYQRDQATLARPWVIPGTPGLEHRVGSLEKQDITGNVSYDPDNHDKMVRLRAEKIARVADDIPLLKVNGEPSGKTLVLGWGSTEGAIIAAVNRLRNAGKTLSCAHLHYLNPMPKNTEEVLRAFDTIIIPEINLGQLNMLIRSRYLIDTISLNSIKGRPLSVEWLEENIANVMTGTHQALAGKE